MTALTCPCGCGRAPRPGRMFAGPHLACLARWRAATGQLTLLADRLRPTWTASKRAKATRRANAEASGAGLGTLSPAEADLWRTARLLGYDNAGKSAQTRARVDVRAVVAPAAVDAVAAFRATGHRGGALDSTRKHGEALRAHAARHGLRLTRRVVAVWAAAYKHGYARRYGPAYDATVARWVRRVGGDLTAVRRQLEDRRMTTRRTLTTAALLFLTLTSGLHAQAPAFRTPTQHPACTVECAPPPPVACPPIPDRDVTTGFDLTVSALVTTPAPACDAHLVIFRAETQEAFLLDLRGWRYQTVPAFMPGHTFTAIEATGDGHYVLLKDRTGFWGHRWPVDALPWRVAP